jgi:hypothetical protein
VDEIPPSQSHESGPSIAFLLRPKAETGRHNSSKQTLKTHGIIFDANQNPGRQNFGMSEDTRNPTGAAHRIGKTGEDKMQNVAPVSVLHVLADASCFVEYAKPLHWQSSDKARIELAHAIGESLLIDALDHASHSKSHI